MASPWIPQKAKLPLDLGYMGPRTALWNLLFPFTFGTPQQKALPPEAPPSSSSHICHAPAHASVSSPPGLGMPSWQDATPTTFLLCPQAVLISFQALSKCAIIYVLGLFCKWLSGPLECKFPMVGTRSVSSNGHLLDIQSTFSKWTAGECVPKKWMQLSFSGKAHSSVWDSPPSPPTLQEAGVLQLSFHEMRKANGHCQKKCNDSLMSLSKILQGLNGSIVSSTKQISRVPVDLRVTDGREVSSLGSPQVLDSGPGSVAG